jgi:hypothetical protein
MTMRKISLVAAVAMISILALATVAMARDPHVGTWKLNLAKSTFNPGPAPKSVIIKCDAQDNGYRQTVDIVFADGQALRLELSAKYDGKEYTLAGVPNADMTVTKKVDANTYDQVMTKAGVPVSATRDVFSKDGKTFTRTTKSQNAQGQDSFDVTVFEKQ